MGKLYMEAIVSIDNYPTVEKMDGVKDLTLGDLHGNAVKLLYFLVRHGIVETSAEDYERFVKIYRNDQLTKELLTEFNALITRLKIVNRETLLRFIGDELADRGQNDYFTLKILQKLHQEKINFEILLSNHGVEFVEAYERFEERGKKWQLSLLYGIHAASFTNLSKLIENRLVSNEEILDIANLCYKSHLKVISYSLEENHKGITLFSHAGIGLKTLPLLAEKFKINYRDKTAKELALTIDRINGAFAYYVEKNQVHTLYSFKDLQAGYQNLLQFTNNNVLEFIMWNRKYSNLDRPIQHNNYSISFVHGHDGSDKTINNIYNLDSDVGKTLSWHAMKPYKALASTELQLDEQSKLEVEAAEREGALQSTTTEEKKTNLLNPFNAAGVPIPPQLIHQATRKVAFFVSEFFSAENKGESQSDAKPNF